MRGLCIAAAIVAVACGGPGQQADSAGTAPRTATIPAVGFLHQNTELVVALASLDGPVTAAAGVVVPEAADLLAELKTMVEHGVDPRAPAGIALLDLESRTAVAFATVADPARLRPLVEGSGTASAADDGLIVVRNDTDAVVVRGDQVFVIRAPAPSRRDLAAVRIATVTRDESLATRPSFRAAMSNLELGADAAGYISIGSAARSMLRRIELWEFDLADLAARPTTDNPQQRAWIETALRVAEAEKQLATDVLGALGGIGFGVEMRPGTLALSMTAEPAVDSLSARLLTDRDAPLRLPGAVGPNARFVAAAHTDPESLGSFVDVVLAGFGLDGAGIRATLEQMLGVTIASDVMPALSGEVAFAIDAESHVHIALGLRDAGNLAEALGPDGTTIDIGTAVHVRVVDDQLVATTDPAFFARIAGAARVGASGGAMISVGAGELDFLFHTGHTTPERAPILERDRNDDVAFSPSYVAVERTLMLTRNALLEADRAVTAWHAELARARAVPFGTLDLSGGASGGWLRVAGGLELATPSFEQAVEASDEAIESLAPQLEGLEAEVDRLVGEIDRLTDELLRIRVADIQAADAAAADSAAAGP